LINAMVSNSLTFALGPRLLKPGDEDASEEEEETQQDDESGQPEENGNDDIERGADGIINEHTSLLPHRIVRPTNTLEKKGYLKTLSWYNSLGPRSQSFLSVAWQFANAPLLGALVGAIIGLTPVLHRLFFNTSDQGGYLNAWLTTAIKNIGDLFASMQIIVVGVKLSQSMRRMKRGEDSGVLHTPSLVLVTIIRFVLWPLYITPYLSFSLLPANAFFQDQHTDHLPPRVPDALPRRRPHALVRNDADADGPASDDSGCADGCDGCARGDEDDDCEVSDGELCGYARGVLCGCGELEGG
jgi:predicted permease